MADTLSEQQRSYCMSRVKNKNTGPEIALRKKISAAGIRGYRLHYKLNGTPDIAFPKRKIAVFIDGCLWHKCPKCFTPPASNIEFWKKKINSNVRRDRKTNRILKKAGWRVIRVWQCSLSDVKFRKTGKGIALYKNGKWINLKRIS